MARKARVSGIAKSPGHPRSRGVLVATASVVLLLVLWSVLARVGLVNVVLLPPPSMLLETAWSMIREGYPESTPLLTHIGASLARIAVGYGVAAVLTVPVGVMVGSVPLLFDLISPLVAFFRAVPTISLIPVAIIMFGIGEVSKVLLIGFGSSWVVLTNTIEGVRLVDPAFVRASQALGANTRQILTWVVLPAALPRIITGLRLGLGIAFMVLIAAEMVASESGLGFVIVDGRRFFRADVVLVGMALIGLIGMGLTAGFDLFEKRVLRWMPLQTDARS